MLEIENLGASKLGKYTLLRELGRSGMGIVYLAEDGQLKRRVAIKVLNPMIACNDTFLQRFRVESRTITALSHPNAEEAVRLCHDIAAGLAHYHAAAIIHRNIKPSNILIDTTGAPRLSHFGISTTYSACLEDTITKSTTRAFPKFTADTAPKPSRELLK